MKKRYPDGDGITDEPCHGGGFQTIGAGSGDIRLSEPAGRLRRTPDPTEP